MTPWTGDVLLHFQEEPLLPPLLAKPCVTDMRRGSAKAMAGASQAFDVSDANVLFDDVNTNYDISSRRQYIPKSGVPRAPVLSTNAGVCVNGCQAQEPPLPWRLVDRCGASLRSLAGRERRPPFNFQSQVKDRVGEKHGQRARDCY